MPPEKKVLLISKVAILLWLPLPTLRRSRLCGFFPFAICNLPFAIRERL
jgi:hypothetical protein